MTLWLFIILAIGYQNMVEEYVDVFIKLPTQMRWERGR
jgi:hypothetical protein